MQNLPAPDLSAANNKLVSYSYPIAKQSLRKIPNLVFQPLFHDLFKSDVGCKLLQRLESVKM